MNNRILMMVLASFLLAAMVPKTQAQEGQIQAVNLNDEGSAEAFEVIRSSFNARNSGYDMTYYSAVKKVTAGDGTRIVFVQAIDGITNQTVKAHAVVNRVDGDQVKSEAIVGDIQVLLQGESLEFDAELGLLVFDVPQKPVRELPSFIRPDWDPNITDVPGGCATEIDAYRRILLTWKEDVGEYIFHALNAHRVRIYDSFSHYHPADGGFDEFYLVQMVQPGAKLITSEKVDLITSPDQVEKSQVGDIITEYELSVGDLVYLPRGVMHRGYGGVVAQVITVPGFIPGSEIGVDHQLRAINERLGLEGEERLPFNEEHSHEAVIR